MAAGVKIPEKAIVSACIKYLWMLGCFVWRNNSGGLRNKREQLVRFGKVGSADIIGLTPSGRFLAVECKSAKGKQTEAQIEFQNKIEEKSGIYILAYSLDDLQAKRRSLA